MRSAQIARNLVGDLLDELAEPPPPDIRDAMPFLGETPSYEEVLKTVSRGKREKNGFTV